MSAGSITGDGTLDAPLTISGPVTVNPSGTLEITDTVSLDGAAVFETTIASPTSFDALRSTGALTLTNVSLQPTYAGTTSSMTAADSVTIASSDTEMIGTFSNAADGERIVSTDGFASFLVEYTSTAITLSGINHAPTFNGTAAFSVPETAPIGTTIGTISAADDDTITYSLSAGPFSIDPSSGTITSTAALDFETQPLITLTVTASDGSLSREMEVTISVTNVLEDNLETVTHFLTRIGGPFEGETDPAIIGFDADPDRDGRANVFELWFGTDPSTRDVLPEEAILSVVNVDGADFGAIEIAVAAELDDVLAVDVESSFDLSIWRLATSSRTVLSESEGRRTLRFTDPAALPSSDQPFFFRFTAEENTPNPSI